MSLMSLKRRVRRLERKAGRPRNGGFTLMELCRVMWAENKEGFKELAQGTSLNVAVGYLQAEDAMREQKQKLREEQAQVERLTLQNIF